VTKKRPNQSLAAARSHEAAGRSSAGVNPKRGRFQRGACGAGLAQPPLQRRGVLRAKQHTNNS
jgi:hypothetical protein